MLVGRPRCYNATVVQPMWTLVDVRSNIVRWVRRYLLFKRMAGNIAADADSSPWYYHPLELKVFVAPTRTLIQSGPVFFVWHELVSVRPILALKPWDAVHDG